MHNAANGQDFGQSGTAGVCFGQQGIPSDMDAMSSIAAADAIATDGAATGAMSKLPSARIESRRGRRAQSLMGEMSHMLRRKRRGTPSHFRQAAHT
jgi:hypothetical protein